ncbi:MAG: hypothetical protein BWK80_43875 [Desulfobacteraceae bacterium IS3]|nr:MAG: hypothetical protein BWK80_43875 [Desulfobacteraceae bacterium IS3]
MNGLKIEATKYIPGVSFDRETNVFDIKGDSYPENTAELYSPVFSWVKKYLDNLTDNQKVTINIELGYFNSSSSQILMDFFDMLEKAARSGRNITVNWIYDEENEISLEHGEEFHDDLKAVTFNLMPKKEAE